jgi:hypothetical protein
MALTPLNPTSRYVPEGTRKVYWLPTVAAYSTTGMTRAEINGGTDLTNEIADISGFTVASDQVEVPDLSGRFAPKIPGRISAADSSIVFYNDATSNDVRTVLPRDTAGYVAILWEGDTAGRKYDLFPAKVGSASMQPGIEDPQKIEIAFSLTKVPAQNMTVPA